MHTVTELPLASPGATTLPLMAVRPDQLPAFLESRTAPERAWLESQRFAAAAQELVVLPGPDGLAGAVLGLGRDTTPAAYGALATRLPADTAWHLEGAHEVETATLGFCLGGYYFAAFRPAKRALARLAAPPGADDALATARACFLVRDLINTPANLLGPAELADAAAGARAPFRRGQPADRGAGARLRLSRHRRGRARVGAAARGGRLHLARQRGATMTSPLVSLCGKGVVFDTGGYDLKPSAGMLRMKKDMGGAATVLGMARVLMQARPADPARRCAWAAWKTASPARDAALGRDRAPARGCRVEVGNTDAEGRLVLADLLAEACEERPDLLLDCATLTGAARVALGPDLPALSLPTMTIRCPTGACRPRTG